MKRCWFFVISTAVFAILLGGCGSKNLESERAGNGQAFMTREAPAVFRNESNGSAKMLTSDVASPQAYSNSADNNPAYAVPEGRKLIFTASITIAVPNVQNSAEKLETQLAAFNAYTASQDWQENSVSYQIKVPVEQFDSLMETLGAAGKVRRKNVQARDVTEYYYDLENRVKNKRILVERYQTYLKNAKNVEDLLNVERFLNDATTELESLEGNFRGLVQQVDYATISLTIESEVSSGLANPGLWDQLKNLFASFTVILQQVLVLLVGAILYGVPLVLLLALLWWVLFGKIGLVRKLFRLVSAEKK